MNQLELLYSSGETNEVKQLADLLEETAINVTVVAEAHLLKGRVELPFIETPTGRHIVGLDAIKRYLEECHRNSGE